MKTFLSLALILLLCITCSKDENKVQYKLSATSSPTDGGSVSSSSGTFDSGEEIQLTATPVAGYVFKNWSGAVTSSVNPLTISFNTDKNITAVFEKIDTDNDGIPDDEDTCSETPAGESVDEKGCSQSQNDSDGDGVSDAQDQCPDTPMGNEVDTSGCSIETKVDGAGGEIAEDTDGDGIADDLDECAATPEGEQVNSQGCSESQSDADGDGVNNDADRCANTPEGEDVDDQGCSESQRDTDGDGINDDTDQCSATPEGEEVDTQGCSESQSDADGDGVNDDADQCDDTPENETADSAGCSESQKDTDNDGVNDAIDQCETPDGDDVDETGCTISLTTFVPDDNFEQTLINEGLDDVMDDFVLTSNIANVLSLTLGGEFDPIGMDLTGLEDFTSIEELDIQYVDNLVLDLSLYPSLKRLYLQETNMTTLLINQESNLEELRGDMVRIETLIIDGNSSLVSFGFIDGFINELNVLGNLKLEFMTDFDGSFENVRIANNPLLRRILFGESDDLEQLELGRNENLEIFNLSLSNPGNYPLDFSQCPNLRSVDLSFRSNGNYGSIDISESPLLETLFANNCGLTSLDVSNNPLLTELTANGNPLTCIQVSEAQSQSTPAEWVKDDTTEYLLDCTE